MSGDKAVPEVMVWHDEMDRLAVWGTLDPPDACMCRDCVLASCGCPTNEFGDIRCHVCGEYVNKRCWNCRTPRGEGTCPNRKEPGS